ncbi:octopine dehydrogenase-like [Octopus vulgaris]|uniref:Octopine dehydrogenase-like n=2 Tax=Octopus vulgaris TaxID=6645 RepID=A0AA36FF74_OCTVU|nr:octopine dehydrogenase-like [Octopus vulgaris]
MNGKYPSCCRDVCTMGSPVKITVCGSNPTSQLIAGLASSRPNMEVTVFATESKAADNWKTALKAKDAKMVINFPRKDGSMFPENGRPGTITDKAGDFVAESDVIILSSPPNHFQDYLKAMKKYIKKRTVIIGVPGRSGFEYQCRTSLEELGEQCTIVNLETCPWVCEQVKFGSQIDVKVTVASIVTSTLFGTSPPKRGPLSILQLILGGDCALQNSLNFMSVLLSPFVYLECCLLFGRWSEWDEKPLESELGLFEDVSEKTAEMISKCSNECSKIIQAIKTGKPELKINDYKGIEEWFAGFKDSIGDSSSLLTTLKTCKIWGDIKHPMKKDRKKSEYTPDLEERISEYLSYGLIVIRGVAEILQQETPVIDKLITWCQTKSKKNYMKDGKVLTDKNIQNTSCPQKFKFSTLNEILFVKALPTDIEL